MTNPTVVTPPPVGGQDGSDTAADELSQLVAGNTHLVTHPDLVQALYSAGATQFQAQAINMFVGGLKAQARVESARFAGAKINLSQQEQAALNTIGVNYADVQANAAPTRTGTVPTMLPSTTPSAPAKPAQGGAAELLNRVTTDTPDAGSSTLPVQYQALAEQNPKQFVSMMAGNEQKAAQEKAAFDAQTEASIAAANQSNLDKVGSLFGRVGHDITHNPVTNLIGEGYNLTSSAFTGWAQTQLENVLHPSRVFNNPLSLVENISPGESGAISEITGRGPGNVDPHFADEMKAAGYDASNPWSVMSYMASGKSTIDLSNLYDKYDPKMVDDALKMADDPEGYVTGVANMPDAQRKAAWAQLDNPDFKNLVTQINARRASPGNLAAQWIDPVKHPDLHTAVAAPIDVAFMFMADPTNIALTAGLRGLKASQLALDSMGDTEKVRAVLDGTQRGVFAAQTRRGVQSLLDNTAMIRQGIAEGDDALVAKGYARIRTQTPGLKHLADDFLGGVAAHGFAEGGLDGLKLDARAPITTMAEATDYLASKAGLVRLMAGRPAAEALFLPGQLSRFGFRAVRGALVGRRAAAGAVRTSRINLNSAGVASRILQTADDAVDMATGKVVRNNGDGTVTVLDESGQHAGTFVDNGDGTGVVNSNGETFGVDVGADGKLLPASQLRARASAMGEALYQSRKGLGGTVGRARLAAQRLSSYLPRNTTFYTDDPNASQRVFQYARMYLTPGDANVLAGLYAAGNEGVKKAILQGMELQTMHAAGLAHDEIGTQIINEASNYLEREVYASTGNLDRFVDPLTGEERSAALYDTQVNPKVTLTGFNDLRKYGAKFGIWRATIGRAFESQVVDHLMGIIKPGWLITGTNVLRNSGEDLFGAAVRGEFGDVLKAKAMAARRGLLPKRTKLGNAIAAPFGRVGLVMRKMGIDPADPKNASWLQFMDTLTEDEMAQFADNWTRLHMASMVDTQAIRDADDIIGAKYQPRRLRFRRNGFGKVDVTEDIIGAERLTNALARIVNANPEHARVLLDVLDDPQAAIGRVLKSFEKNSKKVNQMTRSRVYQGSDGVWHQAISDGERKMALQQLAGDQVTDFRYLMSGRNGELNQELMGYIREHGAAPPPQWIMDHLAGDARPLSVNAPLFEAVPTEGGVTGFVGALADNAGIGYRHLVERPITRMSTMPIFLMNYAKVREALEPLRKAMLEEGMSGEVADKTLKDMAMTRAFNRTVKYVDDPTLRTQMDIVGRNFFAFSRATTAFIRRWGTQFLEDPARLRRAMLAMESAQKTGLVYTDPNGEKQFIFPGSGLAIEALQQFESVFPGMDVVKVPGVTPDLGGSVALLQPGLQNPLQFSLTPIVNIPMRFVFNLMPNHRQMFNEIDTFLNGRQGAGASWLKEITPTALKKFTDALDSGDRDSMLADSTRAAILNLRAARESFLSKIKGKPTAAQMKQANEIFPGPQADAAQRANFLANLKTQVQNQLIFRAAFGYFTPAPPGLPTEATQGSGEDWFYTALGARGLDSEYKAILNQVSDQPDPYGTASQIWAELHPDKLFYQTPSTVSSTQDATIAATKKSEAWLESHLDFMKKYQGVSAYFVPADTQQGNFDLNAYHAQFQLGLRQHKTTAEFFDDVSLAQANQEYFSSLDARNAYLDKHPDQETEVMKQWDAWSKNFKTLNPLFATHENDYTQGVNTSRNNLDILRRLVKDKPSGIQDLGVVGNMIAAYDTYHNTLTQYPGSSIDAQIAHKSLGTQYSQYMEQAVKDHPELAGLYQGVFQKLDSKYLTSAYDLQLAG